MLSNSACWRDAASWRLIDQVDRERGANRNQSRGIQLIHAKRLTHHPNTRYQNHFGTSKSRLMETNQRKSLISRSYLKRSRMWHRKVSTQKRSKVIVIQIDKYYWFKNFLKSSFMKILLSTSFVRRKGSLAWPMEIMSVSTGTKVSAVRLYCGLCQPKN